VLEIEFRVTSPYTPGAIPLPPPQRVIQYFTVPRFVFTAIDAGQRSKPIKFVDFVDEVGMVERFWSTRQTHRLKCAHPAHEDKYSSMQLACRPKTGQNGMGIVRTWKAATRADHSPQSPVFGKQLFKLKVQSPL